MINDLLRQIPLIDENACLTETSERELFIFDDPQSWCYATNNYFHFKVVNTSQKRLFFLAIDKCCLDHRFAGKRCDFGLILEGESFFLVEIKDTIKIKRKNKSTAVKQLENTIKHFESLSLFDSTPQRTAIISWNYSPTRPISRSSINSARVRFFKEYRFDLQEGNELNL